MNACAGVENSQHYDNAAIEFMGIANIHKMRESLDALKSASTAIALVVEKQG